MELNTISDLDARDRLDQIIESLDAYVAVTDTNVKVVAPAVLSPSATRRGGA